MYLFFSFFFLDTLVMYLRSCDHVMIANFVLVDIYIYIYTFEVAVLSLIFTCIVFFFSLYASAS